MPYLIAATAVGIAAAASFGFGARFLDRAADVAERTEKPLVALAALATVLYFTGRK